MSASSVKTPEGLTPRKLDLRAKRPIIHIVCEGEKTEVIYFRDLKRIIGRDNPINIKVRSQTGETPSTLVDFAINLMHLSDFDETLDQIWCVFDVDNTDNEEIRKAYDLAGQMIRIAMSNPCFELWFLLHFGFTTASLNPTEARKRLERQIHDYKKNKSITSTIVERTQNASRNAEKLRAYHQNNETDVFSREANPCTHVDKLVNQFPLP